ncbi:MAG: hypothetical protein ACT4OP_01880 [Actinomycetota bacterium]
MTSISTDQHNRLLSIVLGAVGDGAEVIEDGWAVTVPGSGGVLGLGNLAQELTTLPEEDWSDYINDRIERLTGLRPELPSEYPPARLRVRLSADASDPGWAAYRPVCEGLDETLMMRNEVGCITVSPDQVNAWGVSLDRAWADARRHTIWDEPRERRILARGDLRLVWVRANFFASSVLVDLAHLLSPHNRFGALAMVPTRDALLYVEVSDDRVVPATAAMLEIGSQWYVDGPGSISPEVFWYRADQTISRVVKVSDHRYEPCWGKDMSAVLAELEATTKVRRPPGKRRSPS